MCVLQNDYEKVKKVKVQVFRALVGGGVRRLAHLQRVTERAIR